MEMKKILIIEDEKPIARALELKLKHVGFDVEVAFNGEDGIKLLSEKKYDLILLDLVMPKVNGFIVLEEAKKIGIKTPIIVLSNLSQEEDEKRVRQLGAKAFFIKSNTPIAVIVEEVLKVFKK